MLVIPLYQIRGAAHRRLIHTGLLRFVSGYTELLRKMLVGLGSEDIPANYYFISI